MSIFLAVAGELDDGAKSATFCCGQYDIGTGNCTNGNAPRTLDRGYVYYPNTQMTLDEYTSSLSNSTNGTLESSAGSKTIGVATGVALGVPLLIAIMFIVWQWHLLRKLKKKQALLADEDGILLQQKVRSPNDDGRDQSDSEGKRYADELPVDQTQVSEMAHEPERQELDIQR